MKKIGPGQNKIWHILLILPLLLTITNCAVLTQSQIYEVEKFAKTSKQYNNLPGMLPESYGILLRNNKLLKVSREEFGTADKKGRIDPSYAKRAWQEIKDAYRLETDLYADGRKLKSAHSILAVYSEILATLVSDDYNEALSRKAQRLGKKLDKITDEYNGAFSKNNPIDKIGGTIAMAIRGASGIYLRNKQAAIIQTTVEKADPMIESLMKDIEHIALHLFKPAFQNYEDNYLGQVFKSVAINSNKISVCTTAFVYDDLKRTRNAIDLSDKVAKASKTYRQAHLTLVKNTRFRKDLEAIIEQIDTLDKEIDEAETIEKKVNR